jgi:hypothetical protein
MDCTTFLPQEVGNAGDRAGSLFISDFKFKQIKCHTPNATRGLGLRAPNGFLLRALRRQERNKRQQFAELLVPVLCESAFVLSESTSCARAQLPNVWHAGC